MPKILGTKPWETYEEMVSILVSGLKGADDYSARIIGINSGSDLVIRPGDKGQTKIPDGQVLSMLLDMRTKTMEITPVADDHPFARGMRNVHPGQLSVLIE